MRPPMPFQPREQSERYGCISGLLLCSFVGIFVLLAFLATIAPGLIS